MEKQTELVKRNEEILTEPPLLRKMLLVEKVHYTFEQWLIRSIQMGLILETEPIRIIDLRSQYLRECWAEELKWKEWSNAASQ